MECFDIYDSEGRRTGKWGVKGVTQLKPDEFMRGANLWLINPDGQLLIQKRTMNLRNAPGKWAMTGGSVMHNETTKNAAIREMEEELGIRVSSDQLIFLETFIKEYFVIDAFIAKVKNIQTKEMLLQRTEVQEARWATPQEIDELVAQGEFMDTDWEFVKKFINENM